ncbi:MAG: PTS sugar transporter subunit IIA [Planctomycetota bacterium]
MKTDLIKLDLQTKIELDPETGALSKRQLNDGRRRLLAEMVELMEEHPKVGNPSRLITDLYNREQKASTAIGHGIAVPHVRTYQAKDLIISIGRSAEGIEYDAPDHELVHLFFVMAAPPYDDTLYLKVFKALAENLQYDYFRERLLNAAEPYDFIHAFKEMA